MEYPLPESIGEPDLLVGREKEFSMLDEWISLIPRRLSKSKAILARRKSGKTAIVQRIFNRLWSENGAVIPFYIHIPEKKMWYPSFAVDYYRTFASQYISFLERDPKPVRALLTLEQIKEYAASKSIDIMVTDVNYIRENLEKMHDQVWGTAASAPSRYAALFDQRILVIIDEFQNTGEYIYRDEACQTAKDETVPGTWHDLSESKIAPMLVTGSYVGWMINIIDTYLEAGRLKRYFMNPYLPTEEGLQTVYKYAEIFRQDVTNESALQINRLCMSDPFFISCVVQSSYADKDLTTESGVVETAHYEIADPSSELSMAWGEYIELSLKRINTVNSKHIMLHMSKHSDREWTPGDLKQELGLDIDTGEIRNLLKNMAKADLIQQGGSDIRFQGLTDGTLSLILRHRFEEEIQTYQPDIRKDFRDELTRLKKDKRSLQGMVNHLSGKMAEYQLFTEFRSKKRFSLSRYFAGVKDDTRLNIVSVKMRVKFQRADGKEMEIDVLAESDCGRVLTAEVKKTQTPVGLQAVQDFLEKTRVYAECFPEKQILPGFFSAGGFTKEAEQFCEAEGIGIASEIRLDW